MRTALMVLALLAAPAFAAQAVWKWVDEKGVTHYADRPVPGAQRVEIAVGSPADSAQQPPPYTSSSPRAPAAAPDYRNFEITRPADQESIVNQGGTVEVQLQIEPALQPGHSISLYLDGQPVQGFQPRSLAVTLDGMPRGEHSLSAVIEDRRGNRIKETSTVRFYVRQNSIAQPPVGPALRPPVKK
jgi:hypothetical protein